MPDIEKEIQEQNGQTANKPDAEETVKGEKEVVSERLRKFSNSAN